MGTHSSQAGSRPAVLVQHAGAPPSRAEGAGDRQSVPSRPQAHLGEEAALGEHFGCGQIEHLQPQNLVWMLYVWLQGA